jgi:hypothetical protein
VAGVEVLCLIEKILKTILVIERSVWDVNDEIYNTKVVSFIYLIQSRANSELEIFCHWPVRHDHQIRHTANTNYKSGWFISVTWISNY